MNVHKKSFQFRFHYHFLPSVSESRVQNCRARFLASRAFTAGRSYLRLLLRPSKLACSISWVISFQQILVFIFSCSYGRGIRARPPTRFHIRGCESIRMELRKTCPFLALDPFAWISFPGCSIYRSMCALGVLFLLAVYKQKKFGWQSSLYSDRFER